MTRGAVGPCLLYAAFLFTASLIGGDGGGLSGGATSHAGFSVEGFGVAFWFGFFGFLGVFCAIDFGHGGGGMEREY